MSLTIKGPLSWSWNKVLIPKVSPYESQGCRSSDFRFRDFKWRLECCNKQDRICLYLYSKSPFVLLEDTPITVSVQVQEGNDNGQVLPHLCDWNRQLPSYGGCIWCCWKYDIQRFYPEFEKDHKLTFQITFKETNSQTSTQTGWPVSDASTQTERLASVTASLLTANDIRENSSTPHSSTTDSSEVNSSTNHSKIQTPLSPSTSPCLVNLLEDFAKLLDEESYSDVEFHCEDFFSKAHKAVVSTRSPVLARMLKSDMVEGKTGIVQIKDMDADTFKQFFRYLYTGKLDELTFDAVMALYEAAHKYEVYGMASNCSEIITKNLSEQNSYDVLILADSHSDFNLREVVIEYMVKCKFPLSSDRWSKFSDEQPKLAVKVLNEFCQKWAQNVLEC